VTVLALLPLFLTLLVASGTVFFVMKRKSLAQAICVQQAALIQRDLKQPLHELLGLNSKAESLRAQRAKADASLASAMASGQPYAIAAAKAAQEAVILSQSALHARQLGLFDEAENLREQGERELRRRTSRLALTGAAAPRFYPLPLAVEPKPPGSPSPNYEPIAGFEWGQQERFRFAVDMLAEFPVRLDQAAVQQQTECAVTLERKDDSWEIRVLAAKAPSK
jgi:hypothetical protein